MGKFSESSKHSIGGLAGLNLHKTISAKGKSDFESGSRVVRFDS